MHTVHFFLNFNVHIGQIFVNLRSWIYVDSCVCCVINLIPWFLAFPQVTIHEVHEKIQDALAAYFNALSMEVEHVPSKVSIGALLSKQGPKFLPVARCFLSDALRLEPTNRMAWFYLGEVHKQDGRLADAADCFQADPVESFRSLWWVICNNMRIPFLSANFLFFDFPHFRNIAGQKPRCPAICNLLYLQLPVCTAHCSRGPTNAVIGCWVMLYVQDSSTR